jgi:lysophospholipase L1-like esterase
MSWLPILAWIAFSLAVAAIGAAPAAVAPPGRQLGESLVLAGGEPGQLAHPPLAAGSVVVRSTYLPGAPNSIVYREGEDYRVDLAAGQIRRTEGSRIPDYRRNSLFGQKDFDHTRFPGFGNAREFVYVDYDPRDPVAGPAPAPQADRLARTQARLKNGEALTVVAFGDSITAGGDASAPELIYWQRWLAALRRRYPRATITGVNGATGGDTTVQGLARLQQKVIDRRPDLVLVAFGMNDQNVGGVPLPRFEANLGEIVDRIRRETPAEVILLSSCLPNPNWHYTSGRMPDYGRTTGKVAAEKRCAFADVLAYWKAIVDRKKPEDLLANNVNHPNDFGHWIYFQVLEQLGL